MIQPDTTAVPLPLGSLGAKDDEWFATPVEGAPQ
jgi:hypothetical protein